MHREARLDGEETWGIGVTKAGRSRGRNPLADRVAEAEVKAEAISHPQPPQKRRQAANDDSSDDEYTGGEGKAKVGKAIKGKQKVGKLTEDADSSDTDIPR